ncbi:MAG: hypothetical protein KDK36_19530 [Leptospiraceae bacterium]|nr:hypothetical protein [Leptospiraceae bacterium]
MFKYLLIGVIIFVVTCSQKKNNEDRSGLEQLVLNNFINGTSNDSYINGSLLILTRADLAGFSYTGQCMEDFRVNSVKVSPTNYYNTIPGGAGGSLNTDYKKYSLSTSSCSTLKFTPGSGGLGSSSQRPNPGDGFTFDLYTCDPNNNSCDSSAIKAAGF